MFGRITLLDRLVLIEGYFQWKNAFIHKKQRIG